MVVSGSMLAADSRVGSSATENWSGVQVIAAGGQRFFICDRRIDGEAV
jgi:hypothetical protein